MRTKTLYICETCNTEYEHEELAKFCESMPAPNIPYVIGQEIKLKNRNNGYTLAKIKDFIIKPDFLMPLMNDVEHLNCFIKIEPDYSSRTHNYNVVLEHSVYLDHKWENYKNEINNLYILSEEEAVGMERMDNNCS